MFFPKVKRPLLSPVEPKIEVFVRYANHSSASAHKKRPDGYRSEICYQNLLDTADHRVNLTFFHDIATKKDHFIENKAIPIVAGCEASSFLQMLDYVCRLPLKANTIVYFLEEDYLHRKGWVDILFEGFSLPVDYITLYDHLDKYRDYPRLFSKIYVTKSCHWRTTPSTTNTYAMRFSTLALDLTIHKKYSMGGKITRDHKKFCHLKRKGAKLISPIPGWSTHVETDYLSPCIEWKGFFKESSCTRRSV